MENHPIFDISDNEIEQLLGNRILTANVTKKIIIFALLIVQQMDI